MRKARVRWTIADKRAGSRKNGWELMRTRLEAASLGSDTPALYVFDTCRQFLRTVPSIPATSATSTTWTPTPRTTWPMRSLSRASQHASRSSNWGWALS